MERCFLFRYCGNPHPTRINTAPVVVDLVQGFCWPGVAAVFAAYNIIHHVPPSLPGVDEQPDRLDTNPRASRSAAKPSLASPPMSTMAAMQSHRTRSSCDGCGLPVFGHAGQRSIRPCMRTNSCGASWSTQSKCHYSPQVVHSRSLYSPFPGTDVTWISDSLSSPPIPQMGPLRQSHEHTAALTHLLGFMAVASWNALGVFSGPVPWPLSCQAHPPAVPVCHNGGRGGSQMARGVEVRDASETTEFRPETP